MLTAISVNIINTIFTGRSSLHFDGVYERRHPSIRRQCAN